MLGMLPKHKKISQIIISKGINGPMETGPEVPNEMDMAKEDAAKQFLKAIKDESPSALVDALSTLIEIIDMAEDQNEGEAD